MTLDRLTRNTLVRGLGVWVALALIVASFIVALGESYLAIALGPKVDRQRAVLLSGNDVGEPVLPDLPSLKKAATWLPLDARTRFETGAGLLQLILADRFDGRSTALEAFNKANDAFAEAARRNQALAAARFWHGVLYEWRARESGEAAWLKNASMQYAAAVSLVPSDARYRARLGIVLFQAGETGAAVEAWAASLAISSKYLPEIAALLTQEDDGLRTLESLVPETPDDRLALSDALLELDLPREAYAQWLLANRFAGTPVESHSNPVGSISNGDFEGALGAEFHGWRWSEVPGVRVGTEREPDGKRALLLRFDRAPLNYFHVEQTVPVLPFATYRLSVSYRSHRRVTDRIGADVVLRARDGSRRIACAAAGDPSTQWREASCAFTVPYGVWNATVRLRRYGAEGIEGKGTIWFDRVGLAEVAP